MFQSKGIYLPLSDDENEMKKEKFSGQFKLRRPYLSVLMMIVLMVIVMGIGLFIFTSTDSSELAVAARYKQVSPLILISIDGFRYDYLKRGLTPNLVKLCGKGIHGPMRPQFPSYTFPNHFSLVTGLYPESHGIVGNSFYDPKLKEYFSYTDQENLKESKWWQAEPIWNTVQRFGMKSATMFWPGSESLIFGRRPNYFKTYDETVSTDERVEQVLEWLSIPEEAKRPKFISMYLSLVDDAGHFYGPESAELNETLREVDSGIGKLLLGLKEQGLDDSVNLLIVSDHGMVEIPSDNQKFHIYLNDLIPEMESRLKWVDFGPMASLIPAEGEEDGIIADLEAARMRGVPITFYRKQEIPLEYHYSNNDRIAPIVIIAKTGYIIDFHGGDWVPRGAHGYDPNIPEMQALLIATGPQFRDAKHSAARRVNRAIRGISNLDVYPLMMNLLQISTPPANNGTMALVNLIK